MASWLLPTIDFLSVSRGHYVFVSAHGWSYLLLDNILFNGLLSKSDVLFLWTSHRELDCPCMKKARGRPSYQLNKQPAVKAGRSVFLEILAEPHNTRDFLRHSCGNCKWDWSKYVISSVATFHEVSFRHLTGKVSSLIVFFLLRRFHREKDYSCVKNIDGALKSSKSRRPAKAGLSVFSETLAENYF